MKKLNKIIKVYAKSNESKHASISNVINILNEVCNIRIETKLDCLHILSLLRKKLYEKNIRFSSSIDFDSAIADTLFNERKVYGDCIETINDGSTICEIYMKLINDSFCLNFILKAKGKTIAKIPGQDFRNKNDSKINHSGRTRSEITHDLID